ncbi:MAG: class I SAM-dependent methyltransferase [Anaerolineae bacterium]
MAGSERLYYENEDIWHPSRYEGVESERARLVNRWLPESAGSVLDVGCGNGVVTNLIHMDAVVVGVDRSTAALRWVRTPRVQGDITDLPFGDGSFDVVIATEVLEHLPETVFARALQEMARVSRRHLLISVPYCEDLVAGQCACPKCHCCFNPSYHMRSFAATDLHELFAGQEGIVATRVEPVISVERYVLAKHIRTIVTHRPPCLPRFAICPQCGYVAPKVHVDAVNPTGASCYPVKAVLKRVWPRQRWYRWWMAFYTKGMAARSATSIGSGVSASTGLVGADGLPARVVPDQ